MASLRPIPDISRAGSARIICHSSSPVFSINDRFLFARELFAGSMADFEESLKEVASMESYDEAEEYFVTERGFNTELPIVQDFLNIINNCFA